MPPEASSPLIASPLARLRADFGLHPVTASEIEFYSGSEPPPWDEIKKRCAATGIALWKCEKEKGRGQYEVALNPLPDPARTAADSITLKNILREMSADFSARPFPDQPGSGLHIHVHLADAQGRNVFTKDDESMSDALKYSIGGLLAWLPDCMPVFAPSEESYARFVPGGNAPTTVSWGANNRTVAVRLPDKPSDNKHIEHRVAGADADPQKVIAVILAAIHDGLSRKLDPGPQIYGDASLAQYDLPKLPGSLEEAIERMKASKDVTRYFSGAALLPSR